MISPRNRSTTKKSQTQTASFGNPLLESVNESVYYDIEQNVKRVLNDSVHLSITPLPHKPCSNHKTEDGLYCPPDKPDKGMCMKCAFIYIMVNFSDNDELLNKFELMKKRLMNSYYKTMITNHSDIESHESYVNDLGTKLHKDYEDLQIVVNQTYKECKNALKEMFKNSTRRVLKRFIKKNQTIEQFKEFLHHQKDSLAISIKEIESNYERILFYTNRTAFDKLIANFSRKNKVITKTLERKENFAETVKFTDKLNRSFLDNFYEILGSLTDALFTHKEHEDYDKQMLSEIKRHKSLNDLSRGNKLVKKSNMFLKSKEIPVHFDVDTISKSFNKHPDLFADLSKNHNYEKLIKLSAPVHESSEQGLMRKYASEGRFDRSRVMGRGDDLASKKMLTKKGQKQSSNWKPKKQLFNIEEEKTPPPKQKHKKAEINIQAIDQINLILNKHSNSKFHRNHYVLPAKQQIIYTENDEENDHDQDNDPDHNFYEKEEDESYSLNSRKSDLSPKSDLPNQNSIISYQSESGNVSSDLREDEKHYDILQNHNYVRDIWDGNTFKKKSDAEINHREEESHIPKINLLSRPQPLSRKFESSLQNSKDKSENDINNPLNTYLSNNIKRMPSFCGENSMPNFKKAFKTQEIESKHARQPISINDSISNVIASLRNNTAQESANEYKAINLSLGGDKFVSNRSAWFFKRLPQYNRNRSKYRVNIPNSPDIDPVVTNNSPFGAFTKISPSGTLHSPLNRSSFNSLKPGDIPNAKYESESRRLFQLFKERMSKKQGSKNQCASSQQDQHSDIRSQLSNNVKNEIASLSSQMKPLSVIKEKMEHAMNGRIHRDYYRESFHAEKQAQQPKNMQHAKEEAKLITQSQMLKPQKSEVYVQKPPKSRSRRDSGEKQGRRPNLLRLKTGESVFHGKSNIQLPPS